MNALLKPQHDRGYIGGGNAAGILGVSPYKTPLDEYLTIVGDAEPVTQEQEAFFARRKALEPFALALFKQQTPGRDVARANERYTDPQHSFIRAEIDAETDNGENIEIKTVHPLAAKDWGEGGTDEIPVYVTAQAMHGLMVTGRTVCFPVAMIGFDDFRVYRIERDEETIAAMREREVAFWQRHVERLVPPDPANAQDVQKLFKRDSGTPIEASPDVLQAFNRLRELKAAIKAAEDEAEPLADAIKVFMRDAAVLTADGSPLATWKTQTRNAFDQTAFAAVHSDLVEQFRRAKEIRVFRIK